MKRQSKRTTQTIVAAISLLVIVIAGVPGVDEYRDLRRSAQAVQELRADWEANQAETRKLEGITQRVTKELQVLQSQATGPEEIEAARDRLIEIVRLSGARLRQLDVNNRSQRDWASDGDHPQNVNVSRDVEPSQYRLHSQVLELRAEGDFSVVRKMMDLIASQPWMMRTNRFTLTPVTGDRRSVAIEMTLTLYGLTERPTNSDELAAL